MNRPLNWPSVAVLVNGRPSYFYGCDSVEDAISLAQTTRRYFRCPVWVEGYREPATPAGIAFRASIEALRVERCTPS